MGLIFGGKVMRENKEIKECKLCGGVINPKKRNTTYCSWECYSNNKEKILCKNCGVLFNYSKGNTTYCSWECYLSYFENKKKINILCKYCGEYFAPIRYSRDKTCCSKCFDKKKIINCQQCGVEFKKHRENDKFCGRYCYLQSIARPNEICDQCGQEFITTRKKTCKNKFCSKRCFDDYLRNPFDEHFFENETPEVAYWAGFLMADGCVINTKLSSSLALRLGAKDINHLLLFQQTIEAYDSAITETNTLKPSGKGTSKCYTIRLTSPYLGPSLEKWGVIPNKSYVGEIPFIKDELLPHYIRGLIDGDGSVCISKDGKPSVSFSGNKSVIQYVQSILQFILDTEVYVCLKKKNPKNGHELWYLVIHGKKKSSQIFKWLYDIDGPALHRKKDKVLNFLSFYKENNI